MSPTSSPTPTTTNNLSKKSLEEIINEWYEKYIIERKKKEETEKKAIKLLVELGIPEPQIDIIWDSKKEYVIAEYYPESSNIINKIIDIISYVYDDIFYVKGVKIISTNKPMRFEKPDDEHSENYRRMGINYVGFIRGEEYFDDHILLKEDGEFRVYMVIRMG